MQFLSLSHDQQFTDLVFLYFYIYFTIELCKTLESPLSSLYCASKETDFLPFFKVVLYNSSQGSRQVFLYIGCFFPSFLIWSFYLTIFRGII